MVKETEEGTAVSLKVPYRHNRRIQVTETPAKNKNL